MDFVEVERRVAKLRQALDVGSLTEDQFKAQLRELMVEDVNGNWWMVGYETGKWYRHDGTDWVLDQPPGHATPQVMTLSPARQTERTQIGWGFWSSWVVATAVGGGVGGIVDGIVYWFASAFGVVNFSVSWIVGCVVVGVAIGTAQGLLLRGRIHQFGWWIFASVVGWVVGAPFGLVALGDLTCIPYAVVGVGVGIAQWFVLRRYGRWASIWIPASGIGWGIGGLVRPTAQRIRYEFTEVDYWNVVFFVLVSAVSWAVTGIVAGAILGIPLAWLLRLPDSPSVESQP